MKFNLDNILNDNNISYYELAKRTGMTYSAIYKICKGTTSRVSLDTIEAICIALNCTPNDILIFETK